jgi:hypothetical protein
MESTCCHPSVPPGFQPGTGPDDAAQRSFRFCVFLNIPGGNGAAMYSLMHLPKVLAVLPVKRQTSFALAVKSPQPSSVLMK